MAKTIELAVTNAFDYSNAQPNVQMLYPWGDAAMLPNTPDQPPLGANQVSRISWSPNDELLAVPLYDSTPSLIIYRNIGDKFIPVVSDFVITGSCRDAKWSPDGKFFAIMSGTTPFIHLYQCDGISFTKLPNPATLPTNAGFGITWSPSGEFLVFVHSVSPYITIYRRSGTTFTKIANPSVLPPGTGYRVDWSSCGRFLAIAHHTSAPYFAIYERTGLDTFTKLANPTIPFTASYGTGVAWSPDSVLLAVTHSGASDNKYGLAIYKREGSSIQLLPDAHDTTTASVYDVAWHVSGNTLSATTLVLERKGDKLFRLPTIPGGSGGGAYGCAWSPDGRLLAMKRQNAVQFQVAKTGLQMPDKGLATIKGVKRAGT